MNRLLSKGCEAGRRDRTITSAGRRPGGGGGGGGGEPSSTTETRGARRALATSSAQSTAAADRTDFRGWVRCAVPGRGVCGREDDKQVVAGGASRAVTHESWRPFRPSRILPSLHSMTPLVSRPRRAAADDAPREWVAGARADAYFATWSRG